MATVRVGVVQRAILRCLADGSGRSSSRIDDDMRLTPGRAAGSMRSLWARGLVKPQYTGTHGATQWSLTDAGIALEAELLADGDDDQDDDHPNG